MCQKKKLKTHLTFYDMAKNIPDIYDSNMILNISV